MSYLWIPWHSFIKSLRVNDSTTITSLLRLTAACDAFTEKEKIVARFAGLLIGPYQTAQGLVMTLLGVILALIPCVVGLATVSQEESSRGTRSKIINWTCTTRSPNSPCFWTSQSESSQVVEESALGERTFKVKYDTSEGKDVNCFLGCHSATFLSDIETDDLATGAAQITLYRTVARTFTGYNLMTTGIGKIVDGLWAFGTALPFGILHALYYFVSYVCRNVCCPF